VPDDTLTTAEQQLARAIAPKAGEYQSVLRDYALELSRTAPKDFKVDDRWQQELLRRARARGVTVTDEQWNAGRRYVDQQLEFWITRIGQGDSAAVRRRLPYDAPLRKALEMMSKGGTQRDLLAQAQASARRSP
jgi:hypothetical protein